MASSKPVDGAEPTAGPGAGTASAGDRDIDAAAQGPASTNGAPGDVALSVRDLVKTFEVGGGWLGGERGEVSAVARSVFRHRLRANAGPCGGVGLRQVHNRPLHPASHRADVR